MNTNHDAAQAAQANYDLGHYATAEFFLRQIDASKLPPEATERYHDFLLHCTMKATQPQPTVN